MAFGKTVEQISAALAITPPTLRKNYFRELRRRCEAREMVEAKLLSALMNEVEAGNVSAIDKYYKRLDRNDARELAEVVANRQGDGVSRADKLGKKEQRLQDARAVSGKYAPPPAPRLVN